MVTNYKQSAESLAQLEEIEMDDEVSISDYARNINTIIGMCINNNIPYNKNYQSNNIFLGERTKKFKTLIK